VIDRDELGSLARLGARQVVVYLEFHHAQLSAPSINGADAATAGCCATATIAPDLTPLGMLTAPTGVPKRNGDLVRRPRRVARAVRLD